MDELRVDLDGLRLAGRGVLRTADVIAATLDAAPPLAVHAPGWSVAEALAGAERAAARQVAVLAETAARTGRAVGTAADGYADADERAARRLRAGGGR